MHLVRTSYENKLVKYAKYFWLTHIMQKVKKEARSNYFKALEFLFAFA